MAGGKHIDYLGVEFVLDFFDPFLEGLHIIFWEYWNFPLREDGAGIDTFVDHVHGTTSSSYSREENIAMGVGPGEIW